MNSFEPGHEETGEKCLSDYPRLGVQRIVRGSWPGGISDGLGQ